MNKELQRISLPVFIMYVFACLTNNNSLQEYLKPLTWVTVVVGLLILWYKRLQNKPLLSENIYMLTGVKTDIPIIIGKILLMFYLIQDDKTINDEGIYFCIVVLCVYGIFFDIIGIYKL